VFSPYVAAVFLGTVESFDTPYNIFGQFPDHSAAPLAPVIEVTLSVQEAFKGVHSNKVVVLTPGLEDAVPFKNGEQYLVYAYQRDGHLYTSICNRTRAAHSATEDLDYLRKMQSLPDTSEIFGTYKRYTDNPNFASKPFDGRAPMVGETATVTSETGRVRTTKVDAEGRFSFTGLSPGKYAIKMSVPAKMAQPVGWVAGRPRSSTPELTVFPKGCAEVIFTTEDANIAPGTDPSVKKN
jgi:hypothetical protein